MKSLSQAGQDLFVYNILERKNNGTYLDIGCGSCTEIFAGNNGGSNSLLLSILGWKGIGFDIQQQYKNTWNSVKDDKIYIEDFTCINWEKIINENKMLQNTIDYLSFDVDDLTIPSVKNFPFDKIRFRVITIEHDSYRVGDITKNTIREILKNVGYTLLCSDVMVKIDGCDPWIYEDWWVDMKEINKELAEHFRCDKDLGHNIALRGNNYVENIFNNIKIDISIGEAIDRLSILNIKKLLIGDIDKLNDIDNELNNYNNIINFVKTNCVKEYKNIYKTNKHIWYLSDIIRNNRNDEEYNKALIDVHSYNDKRYIIKNNINNLFDSELKEHKSYTNIFSVLDENKDTINYTSSGLLGDFVNTLYIIKNIYENTNKKGVLYMTNFHPFRFKNEHTYYELIDIILSQEYIEDFVLDNSNNVNEFENKYKFKFINLTSFYGSEYLYKYNWIDIFSKIFNLSSISNPLSWVKINKKINKFENKILIHFKNGDCSIMNRCVNMNNCIFISCDKKEYDCIPYKDKLESYYICEDLNELFYAINSCKFFIGVQSSPLAMAVSMGQNCLGILNGMDHIHYVGIENYSNNFYWIYQNNNSYSHNFNDISKFINI